MKRLTGFSRSRAAVFTHDLLMILLAWLGAYWLRFTLEAVPADHWRQALLLLPVVWLSQGAMFWYFGLYRGIWRFASIPDLTRILKAVATSVVIAATLSFILTRLKDVPRSVFILDGILLVLLLGGPRLVYRWWKGRHFYRWMQDRNLRTEESKNALIVGAGRAGEMLTRDPFRDQGPDRPVPPVDDNHPPAGR